MSISRTLLVLAAVAAPVLAQAQATDPVQAGDSPIVLRPTVGNDTLWALMKGTVATGQVTHAQAMVAVLRQNPQAFVRGNMHALRKGVALTIPTLAQIKAENRARSELLVNEHLRLYEEGQDQAAPAPYALPAQAAPAGAASAPAAADKPPVLPKPASAPAAVPASAPVAASGPLSRSASASAAPVLPRAPVAASAVAPQAASAPVRAAAASQPVTAPARVPAASAPSPVVAASSSVASAASASQAAAASAAAPSGAVEGGQQGGGTPLAAYLIGAALAAAAAGWWLRSRKAGVAGVPVAAMAEPSAPEPRLVQVSTAAVDMARSLDAMLPAYELVRRESADSPGSSAEPDRAAEAALKLELARACVEVRRHDEAYELLQFVLKHGSEAQQQQAHELLRGSD